MSLAPVYASVASYLLPEHLVLSAWHEHAPFASWLIDVLRPRQIVELGTHNGFSLFTMADSVRRFGLEARIIAIDAWEGDDHAGFYGPEILEGVRKVVDAEYADIIELRQSYFAPAAAAVADGSVDLLHVDGRHGYDDVREDFEAYWAKLSPRGVALFHDCFEFREGFGVHRYWDEIASQAPSFRFEHGHGLGVLVTGDEAPDSILRFIEYANEHPEEVREFYHGLGERVATRYEDQARSATVDVLRAEVIAERAQLARVQEREQLLTAEVAELRGSTSWRLTAPLRAISGTIRGR